MSSDHDYDFDAIVIGGGSPGEHCANALAEGGLRVAVVERELLGGECSYWACIPSKTLLRAGRGGRGSTRRAGCGRGRDGQRSTRAPRWRGATSRSRTTTTPARWRGRPARASRCSAATGRLAGPHVVAVGGETYTAEHIVLATGSDPVIPPIPGLRELEGVWTSRDATGLTEVPRRLLVLGAGPVGVEMAQALARLGASVTLVESGDHVLPREPRAVGEAVGEALAADGVTLRLGQPATAARRDGEDYVLELRRR